MQKLNNLTYFSFSFACVASRFVHILLSAVDCLKYFAAMVRCDVFQNRFKLSIITLISFNFSIINEGVCLQIQKCHKEEFEKLTKRNFCVTETR